MSIKPLSWITFLCSFVALPSYADINSLKNAEDKILNKYKQADFFEVNGDIMTDVSALILNDADSFKYDFPKLKDAGFVQIQYSKDKKLKFYTFDLSGGGTMGEWDNYVQYYTGSKIHYDEFDAGHVHEVKQVNIQQKPVYLVESYYKGDSCHGAYYLRAVEIGEKQLLKAYVFSAKGKTHHDMSVEYDCRYPENRSAETEYFRINDQNVDVLLLNEKGIPQNKYLRYRLDNKKGYIYSGVVK